MRCNFTFLILALSLSRLSPAQEYEYERQINEQVWQRFISAYNALDTDGFMAVHSKKMTRVIQDEKRVMNYREYYRSNRLGNANARQYSEDYGASRKIELRFTSRMANKDKAFECGYYKVTNTLTNGEVQCFYGRFEVLLHRENRVWKILMDADSFDDTDEAAFQTGKAMNN